MKWLIIIGIAIFAIGCLFVRNKRASLSIAYKPASGGVMKFSFKFQEADTLTQVVTLLTTAVRKYNGLPMFIQTGFKGQRKDAENVVSMKLKLYAKNATTGLYDQEVVIQNSYAYNNFSFYSRNVYGIGEKNYTDHLGKLIHLPNDYNKADRMNGLYIDHELTLEKYPQEIKAVITVKWVGGEQTFSTILVLDEYYPRSIRTNPFG